jgi:ABC-2 type transport system permease protein
MTAFANHTWIELRSSLRNRQLLFLTYAFPLAFYAMMGLIMTQINPLFTEAMIPAMAIFAIMIATLMTLPDPLVTARDAGIFRSYKIHGVPALNILSAPTLTTFLHLLVVMLIILATATPLFDAPAPANWGWFALVTLCTVAAFAGLGVLIGVVSSTSRATLLWSQLIFLPSMLISGLMMPFAFLPAGAQVVARLLPTTYAMNAYNGLAYGAATPFSAAASVVILLAGGLLAFGLAGLLFNWDRQNRTARLHPVFGLLALLPYVAGMLVTTY